MALIMGARHKINSVDETLAKIAASAKSLKVEIQVLDASRICGKEHLIIAAEKAERSFSDKRNLSNTLATEVLLYAASERQISQAIMKLGIKEGIEKLAIVVFGEIELAQILSELGWEQDDSVLNPLPDMDIDAIIEKMALSELER